MKKLIDVKNVATSNLLEWKSTAVGTTLTAAHLYQHFWLGTDLSIETLFAAGYIILGASHGKK